MTNSGKTYCLSLLLALALGVSGCGGEGPLQPLPVFEPPRVPGIFFTDESGNQYGTYGQPVLPERFKCQDRPQSDSSGDGQINPPTPVYSGMGFPYPNPAYAGNEVTFSTCGGEDVQMIIVPALGPFEQRANGPSSIMNSPVFKSQESRIIFDRKNIQAGQYTLALRMELQSTNPIPTGFYRIYLNLNEKVSFVDVYLSSELEYPVRIR